MKLIIDSSKRFLKKVSLFDQDQKLVVSVESDEDILVLVDKVLKIGKTGLSDLTSVKAKLEGESRVGINIGVSAANALNYSLGLKQVEELEFPLEAGNLFK